MNFRRLIVEVREGTSLGDISNIWSIETNSHLYHRPGMAGQRSLLQGAQPSTATSRDRRDILMASGLKRPCMYSSFCSGAMWVGCFGSGGLSSDEPSDQAKKLKRNLNWRPTYNSPDPKDL